MGYCSPKCLKEDKADHLSECDLMEELWDIPDISRIIARLLLKLNNKNSIKTEALPFDEGHRAFQELLSHSDKIDDDDEYAVKIFETLDNIITSEKCMGN